MNHSEVTRGNAPLFVEAYNECVENDLDVFKFGGTDVNRRYAFYLIEFIASKGWVKGAFEGGKSFTKFVSNK